MINYLSLFNNTKKMNSSELTNLIYRRQYLITPVPIKCPFKHNLYYLNEEYKLYVHNDLTICTFRKNETQLILLGELFSFIQPELSNAEILELIFTIDLDILLHRLADYCGRFVMIIAKATSIFIVHDANAARKVYYHKTTGGNFCSSRPNLIAEVVGLQKTRCKSKLSYYESLEFIRMNNAGIGNNTIYDHVFQLIPNHSLDVINGKVTRYWPKNPIENMTLSVASKLCAKMINGFINAIGNRYPLMIPVTAGKDSRTLLACSRDVSNKTIYYINKENHLHEKSNDLAVPSRLLKRIGLNFHIIDPYAKKVDDDFRRIYFRNNPLGSEHYLPIIYNYYRFFGDRINIPGNTVASAYDLYGKDDTRLSGLKLAKWNSVARFDFAIEYYNNWLREALLCKQSYNMNINALFYWEERMANWGTQIQLDKDIAQEEFVPFNCTKLIEIMLSVEPKYIDRPEFELFKQIQRYLWPELLTAPVNPSFKNKVIKALDKMEILEFARSFKTNLSSLFNNH